MTLQGRKLVGCGLLGVWLVCSTIQAALIEPVHMIQQGDEPIDLTPVKESIEPGSVGPLTYDFVQQLFGENSSIVHSGAANNDSSTYQHAYAYSTSNDDGGFLVQNLAGHNIALIFDEETAQKETGKQLKIPEQKIEFDTFFLGLVKSQQKIKSKSLIASYGIGITREFSKPTQNNPDKVVQRKVNKGKGSIEIFQNKAGKIKIKTKGAIKKKHITAVMNEDWLIDEDASGITIKGDRKKIKQKDLKRVLKESELIVLELDGLNLSYKFNTKVGLENIVTVKMSSLVKTTSNAGGAEVVFVPEREPMIPIFYETQQVVPEPATAGVLAVGVVIMRKRRRR